MITRKYFIHRTSDNKIISSLIHGRPALLVARKLIQRTYPQHELAYGLITYEDKEEISREFNASVHHATTKEGES